MEKNKFLLKLMEEQKILLVDASKDICNSYLTKSKSHYESANLLFQSSKLEEAVSLAYYGMYHSLLALLFRCGLKSENHTGSILLLKVIFKEDDLANIISFAKKERIDKQYYLDFNLSKQDVESMITQTKQFIDKIRLILDRLTEEKIVLLRNKYKSLD